MNKQVALVPSSPAPTKLPILAGGSVSAIVPKSIDEAFRVAEAVCVSGMVPDSYKGGDQRETASRVMIGIMKGMEVGLPPVTALSTIYIVNNKPCIYGDGALALVQSRPEYAGCREWIEGTPEKDDYTAYCEIRRKVPAGEIVTTARKFSWGEAKRASLIGRGPWRQYPQRMLQMRARSWAIRDSFSDALSGLHIAEEVQDIPQKPEQADASFLDDEPARLSAPTDDGTGIDWNDEADKLTKAVATLKTREAFDAFLDASEVGRDGLKTHAPGLSAIVEKAITAKCEELGA